VKQHAQEHQHACACSSIAKPSAGYAAMYDAISIDVSPHVPQATKDNAFCRESALFNIDDNFASTSIYSFDAIKHLLPDSHHT